MFGLEKRLRNEEKNDTSHYNYEHNAQFFNAYYGNVFPYSQEIFR